MPKFWILLLFTPSLLANEVCSRIAFINHQEVLVDSSSKEKGEGLRYFLQRDPVAKSYLDEYQDNNRLNWYSAGLGTLGAGMILSSLFIQNNSKTRQSVLISGIALSLINFAVSRTLEAANEANLERSIEEYNQRNMPKIRYDPEQKYNEKNAADLSFSLEKSWSF